MPSLAATVGGDPIHEEAVRRRVQRLREVREQERRIAAATRARFQQAVEKRKQTLTQQAEEAWAEQQAEHCNTISANLYDISVTIGSAHDLARTEKFVQRVEAQQNLAAWEDAHQREQQRKEGAAQLEHEQAAARRAPTEAAAARRELVAHAEDARAADAVARQKLSEERAMLHAREEAVAAVARAVAAPSAPRRCRAPIDFASTRVHGAVEQGAATRPSKSFADGYVQRHVAVACASSANSSLLLSKAVLETPEPSPSATPVLAATNPADTAIASPAPAVAGLAKGEVLLDYHSSPGVLTLDARSLARIEARNTEHRRRQRAEASMLARQRANARGEQALIEQRLKEACRDFDAQLSEVDSVQRRRVHCNSELEAQHRTPDTCSSPQPRADATPAPKPVSLRATLPTRPRCSPSPSSNPSHAWLQATERATCSAAQLARADKCHARQIRRCQARGLE